MVGAIAVLAVACGSQQSQARDRGTQVAPDGGTGAGPDGGGDAGMTPDGGSPSADGGKLRVLFIGDSYTYVNDLPGMLSQIAATAGIPPLIETSQVVQGGATLQVQWQNGIAQQVIADGGWTHVVLQDQSEEPATDPPSSAFVQYATAFGILAVDAGATPGLFVTWARAAADRSTYPYLFDSPTEMQDELTNAYASVAAGFTPSVLACAGPAFQLAIAQHPEIALQQSDFSHPTVAGTYLAACTFYVALTGKSVPAASAVPSGLSASDAATLRALAQIGTGCADVQVKGIVRLIDSYDNGDFDWGGDGGPFSYGTAGFPLPSIFTLSNYGGQTVGLSDGLSLAPPFAWAGGQFPGGQDTDSATLVPYCTASLDPDKTCELSVTFDGTRTAIGGVSVAVTGAYTPAASRLIQGIGTSRALLTIDAFPWTFGECPDPSICGGNPLLLLNEGSSTTPMGEVAWTDTPNAFDLFVQNRGGAPALGIAPAPLSTGFLWGQLDGGGAYPGGVGTATWDNEPQQYAYCSDTLAPGDWCILTLTFAPAVAGPFDETLSLSYSDDAGPIAAPSTWVISATGEDGGQPSGFGFTGDSGWLIGDCDAGCLPP